MKLFNKIALRAAIVYFVLYWPLAIIGAMYSSGLAWGIANRSLFQSVLVYLFHPLYLIPNTLIGNALLGTVFTYFLVICIMKFRHKPR